MWCTSSLHLFLHRQKLKAQGNHGMTYTAKLKGLLHMMFLQTLSSVGRRQLDHGKLWDGSKKFPAGRMMLYLSLGACHGYLVHQILQIIIPTYGYPRKMKGIPGMFRLNDSCLGGLLTSLTVCTVNSEILLMLFVLPDFSIY